ncbi:restriction endonuclease subunit S [Francisella tularensis subsp. novicida]|uniref:Restriction endonuclease subunit S n=2 Tax=Francisella tularensis TaxID=263 RepID=A0A6I4RNK3_FRATU|nr:restriction endonuclease subunit S [Francisella tularensis]ABK89192.1 type I restriction-modification system, subunit S [Francisella tularensis subsp. novicida U112]AJI61170.1 type I restriction modification DNA specificity domain protein [Francisella tularensis subsp. novicida U112]EDX19052.1 type I restriction modification DNA specificity domain protein [Francisella tularensis subsp. novicida FTE]MBK2035153.1 restriction endonuclease subunit S [Francisella tularensis subsp. novicida]MBK21
MSNSELPKGWRECKLGDFISVKHGYAFKGKNITTEANENILVTPGNFNIGGGFKKDKFKYFNDDYPSEYILNESDIIVTMTDLSKESDTLGYSAKVPKSIKNEKYLHNQRIGLVQFINQLCNKEYIYWLLRTREYQNYIVGSASGTSIMHTSPSRICDYVFLCPPLAEQKAIAEVLSSLDDKIDLLHKQNQTLEDMAQTLFREWFIEKADEGWEEMPLSEVADIKIGRTPPRKEKQWFSNDPKDVKWISIKDMGQEGVFINGTSEYLTQEAVEKFKIPIIVKNTVILSFKMTLGRVKITGENMLSNEAIAHFNITNDKLYNEYLYLFLKTYPYQTLGSTSSIVTSINSAMIKNILIILPDFKVKKSFKEVISPMFEKIQNNQKQIKTLEQTRDTLLPKLMSGQVRV